MSPFTFNRGYWEPILPEGEKPLPGTPTGYIYIYIDIDIDRYIDIDIDRYI